MRDHNALRVLVIEDNPDAAETLGDLLALFGHQAEIRAAAAGFDLHLVKPVGPEALKQLLEGFAEGGPGLAGPGDLQPQG